MSGVDVLAVLDAAIARASGSSHSHLKEARGAVAELISAIKAERLVTRSETKPTRDQLIAVIERTDAALANVGAQP